MNTKVTRRARCPHLAVNRIVSLILSITMLLTLTAGLDLSIYADEYSGKCGNNITWILDKNGKLTISGSGDMFDYYYGDYAPWYSYGSLISSVYINNGVTTIGDFCFYFCKNLVSITMPNSLTSIGNSAFNNCVDLTSVTITDNVTNIGNFAFSDCQSLTEIKMPNNVINIGSGAFSNCYSLISIVVPNGVKKIDNRTFEYCKNLTSITIPNSITSINYYAFAFCSNLTNVIIPDNTTYIGQEAFVGCKGLINITIPNNVTYIADDAFTGCDALISITVDKSNQKYLSQDGVLLNKNKTNLIKYPAGNTSATYTIPNGVTTIGNNSFRNCKNLIDITIPKCVKSIGSYAFINCYNLTTIEIPNGIEYINQSTFEGCKTLANIIIPNSVINISQRAFCFCENLTNVTIGESVKEIKWSAFSDCKSITDVYYNGSKEKWKKINIEDGNDCLINAVIHCIDGDINEKNCAKGHSWDNGKIIIQPTCINTGVKLYTCTICKETKNEQIIALGHKYEWQNINGVQTEVCSVCGSRGKSLTGLKFTDLNDFDFYDEYVAYTSVHNNFINGTNPPYFTEFSPNQSITRAMFVTILYRMAGEPYKNANHYKTSPFTDIKDTNVYYYDAACWALDNDITTQTTFKPYDNVSREQTASFLFRYAQKNNMLDDDAYKKINLSAYPDNSSIHDWAKEAMQWANYNGMITGTQQGYANPQGSTLRIHATKILYGFGKTCNIGKFE